MQYKCKGEKSMHECDRFTDIHRFKEIQLIWAEATTVFAMDQYARAQNVST